MQLINALQNNVLLRSIILEAWLKFEPTGRGWEDERSTYNLKINYLLKREREREENRKNAVISVNTKQPNNNTK